MCQQPSMTWTAHQVTYNAQSVVEFGHVQRGDAFLQDFARSSLYSSFRCFSEGAAPSRGRARK
jgi:hypothetical protein